MPTLPAAAGRVAPCSGTAPAALTMIGAFLVEFRLEPPFWVHRVLRPLVLLAARW